MTDREMLTLVYGALKASTSSSGGYSTNIKEILSRVEDYLFGIDNEVNVDTSSQALDDED